MHLKFAREQGKIEHFISEKEKTHPKASHHHFHATVKAMAAGKSKAAKGASKRRRRDD
jgi:hypothetical protein